MAAVAELLFLLFALLSNIHAEEIIVRKEADSYTFRTPRKVDLCLISRFVSEEKLVLWNTSDLRPENSTVPEELKRRLSVHSRANVSFYTINNLNHSDSGLYQEQCWTEGKLTHETNMNITICRVVDVAKSATAESLGITVNLPCGRPADSLTVQWFKHQTNTWTRIFGDRTTSEMDDEKGRFQVVKNTSELRISGVTETDFGCGGDGCVAVPCR
ncbi:uncharacterized protein AKAME5_002921400 [Lates japonicus]|uniref:Ig-like domain-containing protein n=1 Tax=Lates japonicus TaxID=270547 RepID=A0AAD3N099_LATJO|nr:uncharacterized protein AKAME5_002921400 [Lates japonicus]